jgi:hypothetical protein
MLQSGQKLLSLASQLNPLKLETCKFNIIINIKILLFVLKILLLLKKTINLI